MAKSVLNLGLELELDGRAQKRLSKQIRKELSNVEVGLDVRSLATTLEKVADEVEGLISDAGAKGFKGIDGDSLRKVVAAYTYEQQRSVQKLASLEKQLAKKGIHDVKKRNLERQKEEHANEMKLAEERFKTRLKADKDAFDEFDKSLSRANEKMGASAGEFGRKLSQGFNEAADGLISSLKSGDLRGVLKGIEDTAGPAGEALTARGEARAGQGLAGGGALQQIGKIVKSLGKAAMAAGAIAGAFAAIAKLIIDSESQAREFNATVMEGAGAADLLAVNYFDLASTLDIVRDAAVDFGRNMRMGTTARETLETIRAFNQAGLTFNELTEGVSDSADQMERLQHASDLALTYSRLTGMATTETAEHMTRMVEEFGLSLDGVAGQFSGILDAAMMSGFGVNRFTSMVMQATSGLAIYNARVSETAGLLVMLGDILGSDMSSDFVQSLQRGFVDEGMTDRFGRIMRTGGEEMRGIFENSAENTARDFIRNLESRGISTSIFGVDLNAENLVDTLGAMTSDERSQLLAQMRGTDADLARQLRTLIDVSEGARGGMDNMARNMGSLDAGGRLAATLNSAASIFKNPIHELSAIQLAGFESITGISGQELETLRAVSEGIYGNYDELQRLREEGAELTANQVRAFGAAIDHNGNIVAAHVDELGEIVMDENPIGEIGEYIQSQGESIASAMEGGIAEDVYAAQQVAANTMALSNILENGVQYVLEQIYSETRILADLVARLVPGGSRLSERRAQVERAQENLGRAREEMQTVNEMVMLRERELNAARSGGTYEDRTVAQAALDRALEQQLTAQRRVNQLEGTFNDIRSAFSREDILNAAAGGGENVSEHLSEVYGGDEARDQAARQALTSQMQTAQSRLNRMLERGVTVTNRTFNREVGEVVETEERVTGANAVMREIRRNPALLASITSGLGISAESGSGGTLALTAGETELVRLDREGGSSRSLDSAAAGATEEGYSILADTQLAASERIIDQMEREQEIISREQDARDMMAVREGRENAENMIDGFGDIMREVDMMTLASELAKGSTRSAADIYSDLLDGSYNLPGDFRSGSESARRAALRYEQQHNDFIYRRDGTVIPINRSDEIMGYRPGGPIERAGGGGGAPVTIHVHGGDEARVYNTVQRALRGLGYGPGRVSSSA